MSSNLHRSGSFPTNLGTAARTPAASLEAEKSLPPRVPRRGRRVATWSTGRDRGQWVSPGDGRGNPPRSRDLRVTFGITGGLGWTGGWQTSGAVGQITLII